MADISGRRTELRDAFEHAMGYWNATCEQVLDTCPDWQSVTFGVPILPEEVTKFTQAADAANGGTDARS
jgi:hypothetical protein